MVVCKYLFLSVTFLLSVVAVGTSHGQEKYEVERRINVEAVPGRALNFVDSLHLQRKVRWYEEAGAAGKSLEAKFRFRRHKHSIEFDPGGALQDVEIRTTTFRLGNKIRHSIKSELDKECLKYKIRKVQVQYSGNNAVLLSKIKKGKSADNYTTKYELIVRCKSSGDISLFEYLFSNNGQVITKRKIIFKSSSNLEY